MAMAARVCCFFRGLLTKWLHLSPRIAMIVHDIEDYVVCCSSLTYVAMLLSFNNHRLCQYVLVLQRPKSGTSSIAITLM